MVLPCMVILREDSWPKLHPSDWVSLFQSLRVALPFKLSIWYKEHCPSLCLVLFKIIKINTMKASFSPKHIYIQNAAEVKVSKEREKWSLFDLVFQSHKLIICPLTFMLFWFETFVTCRLKHSIYKHPNFFKNFTGTTTFNSKLGYIKSCLSLWFNQNGRGMSNVFPEQLC